MEILNMEQNKYPSCPTTNYYVVKTGDSLQSIAACFNLTPEDILHANMGARPIDFYEGMYLCIPLKKPLFHISVDLSSYTLTVLNAFSIIKSYKIAIGKCSTPTPTGEFYILKKEPAPSMTYGARKLVLSYPNLTIHGTDNFHYMMKPVTDGSIILFNHDIEELFNLVTIYTKINIM
jgi:L,D-transpeptidase ErfK/SrfK